MSFREMDWGQFGEIPTSSRHTPKDDPEELTPDSLPAMKGKGTQKCEKSGVAKSAESVFFISQGPVLVVNKHLLDKLNETRKVNEPPLQAEDSGWRTHSEPRRGGPHYSVSNVHRDPIDGQSSSRGLRAQGPHGPRMSMVQWTHEAQAAFFAGPALSAQADQSDHRPSNLHRPCQMGLEDSNTCDFQDQCPKLGENGLQNVEQMEKVMMNHWIIVWYFQTFSDKPKWRFPKM